MGKPRKTAPQARPVATAPVAEASERSDDADERRSVKPQHLNLPLDPWVPTMGVLEGDTASDDRAQVRSPAPAGSPDDRTNQGDKRRVQPASQPEQLTSNTSSRVKRDACAADRPDEDE